MTVSEEQPEREGDAPPKWGDEPSEERKRELQDMLDAWNAPDADRRERKGPFDAHKVLVWESDIERRRLTGADVFWLAAQALAGADGAPASPDALDATMASLRATDPGESFAFNLSTLHLEQADLLQAHLEGANLERAHLEGAGLARAHLEGANLRAAHLEEAKLLEAHLERAYLEGAHLERANFFKAHLSEATLGHAHLTEAHLEWAQLTRAYLNRAQLAGANLSQAQLDGANLDGAQLEGAKLSAAHLAEAQLEGAHLVGAYLGGAQLEGAHLSHAHLEGAYLGGAHLEGADLGGARLEGADLSRAHLDGADLSRASFDKASRLNEAHLDHVRLDQVIFDNTNLAVVDWTEVQRLGDEPLARKGKRNAQLYLIHATSFRSAARAYRSLSVALRAQGISAHATRFHYRAELMDRYALLYEMLGRFFSRRFYTVPLPFLRWLGSWVLGTFAGYGDYIGRLFFTYATVVLSFAALIFVAGHQPFTADAVRDALVLSVTSFHGRGVQPPGLPIDDAIATLAGAEAVFGLLIEGIFIAAFTRRVTGG